MWTAEDRSRHVQDQRRYPSDLTDAEWVTVAPLIPPAKHGGRRRSIDMREVVNGILYVLVTGCQWNAVPEHLPSKSTLYAYFDLWTYEGVIDRIHAALYGAAAAAPGHGAVEAVQEACAPAHPRLDAKSAARLRRLPMPERRSRARHHLSWSVRPEWIGRE